jgi:glucosamine--fructose-6-phosphate aminotransferase (isomerizing)
MTTKLFEDIVRQPDRIVESLRHTMAGGRVVLQRAAEMLRQSEFIYILGMGSSWHAGMAIQSLFHAQGRPALLVDASEFLHFTELPKNATLIVLSRSGRSTEIVQLLKKGISRDTKIVGITNTPDNPLALNADVVLTLMTEFDHQVSVSMYTALAMTGGLLAFETDRVLNEELPIQLETSLRETSRAILSWREQLEESDWLAADAPTYFLARGGSVASCYEARLLWEEAAKAPASALTTGGFRHGPQEIVTSNLRIGLWIDGEKMRSQDLMLARDLRQYGAKVCLIGQGLDASAADVVMNIPRIPAPWQFVIDIFPMQIAAECLSRLRGKDCDSFGICSYIVEEEGGLR